MTRFALTGLPLEYTLMYGSACRYLDVGYPVNQSLGEGKAGILGLGLQKQLSDFGLVGKGGPLLDNRGHTIVIGLNAAQ